MDLKLLRDATRAEHEATESEVPLMRADLQRAEYVRSLERFYAVVSAWDHVAAQYAPPHLQPLLGQRRRSSLIRDDLLALGSTYANGEPPAKAVEQLHLLLRCGTDRQQGDPDAPADPEEASAAAALARWLGAMYVVEGSTLGGQYIAAHVEKVLSLSASHGVRYFSGYGDHTMLMWREIQAELLAVPPELSHTVIASAKGMFGIFGTWLAVAEPAKGTAESARPAEPPQEGNQ